MKILVTGGTVFVSKYIAEYFSKRGDEVYVLNRNTKPQLRYVHLIESDRHNIDNKLKNIHFDAVIDVTAYTAEDVDALLDALDGFDRYIMISSSAVYPETLAIPFKEIDKLGANKYWGDYGTNKIAAEYALSTRVPNAYVIRPPYLYGIYNNVYREAFVFDCAEQNLPFYIPQDGAMQLQFFEINDLCRFIDELIKLTPDHKIFNVGNEPITIKQWVEFCYMAVGKTPRFISVSSKIEQSSYFPFYNYGYVLDTTAQNKILNELLPIDLGLRRAYDWYKNNRDQLKPKNYLSFIAQNLK